MGSTRVPKETLVFNGYIVTTDNFLQALSEGSLTEHNWERLGISSDVKDEWHDKRTAWEPLFAKFQDDAQRTTVVIHSVNTAKAEFAAFAAKPLDVIAGSENAVDGDATIFHVVLSGTQKKPTHPTTAITEQCVGAFVPMGGASYEASFRTPGDTGRPSLAAGADSVLFARQVGGTAPTSADSIGKTTVSTKATGILQFGTDNIGQTAYVAYRWYNTKYPDFAGPWSSIHSFLIA